jgi:hypothetical protein
MHHDRPTAAELVQAVREFLERDVMTATTGRVQFHTRVAINALGMVERELDDTVRLDAARRERDDERALAMRIRAGEVTFDDVRAQVRESVRRKLAVANPRYLRAG